jgi:hypothetical protein
VDHCVFIHTNHKQMVGALVAQYALKRNSSHADRFDVRIIDTADYPWLREHEGQMYLRDGVKRVWLNEDLQSFTPLRFMPPKLMGYEGRAIVIDPDIFAVGDVWELLSRDMQGKAIMCRMRSGPKGLIDKCYASSVMLLDCAQLTHWDAEAGFREMFRFERDYQPWICLKLEDRETIGFFEHEWNDFDRLTSRTKMLHNTRRKLFGEYALLGNYKQHPDENQEHFFFGLLKECVEQGIVTEEMLKEQLARNHVRHDAFEVQERTPPLAPAPNPPMELPA